MVLDVDGRSHDGPAVNFIEEEGVLQGAGGRTIGWTLRGPEDGAILGWFHGQPGSRRDLRCSPRLPSR
jgi:hypothetical protein